MMDRVADQLELLEKTASRLLRERDLGGIGGGGDGAAQLVETIRSDFPDTSYWQTGLRTGSSGQAQISFEVPDSLTTWVIEAYAVTDETQVGQGEATLRVTKPLYIRPITPRFLVAGDQVALAAVVHNNTDEALDVAVSLEVSPGVTLRAEPTQQVDVSAGGRTRVVWMVDVDLTAMGSADLIFAAKSGAYEDVSRPVALPGVSAGLPIYRLTAPDVVRTAGVLDEAGRQIEAMIVGDGMDDAEAGDASASVELRVDTALVGPWLARAAEMEGSTLHSTDAWVSRLLPAVASYRALEELEADSETLAATREVIGDALDRLYARQNPDGGWGWWRDLSNVHLTSYAAFGLLKVQEAGFPVRSDALNRGLDYVTRMVDRGLGAELRYPHFAFGLYVLSEADRPWPQGAVATLYGDRDDLGIAGRSYLAQALWRVDPSDPRVMTLVSELRAAAVDSGSGTHWEEVNREQWVTPVQATAVVVDALSSVAPEDERLPQAVRWLMTAREATGWSTAYETAWTLTAMADYVAATGEVHAAYAWSVAFNGAIIHESEELETASGTGATIRLDSTAQAGPMLRPGLNVFEISRGSGAGKLYYTAQLRQLLAFEDVVPEQRGIWVWREYCRATDTDPSKPFVCDPVQQLDVGDLVDVELTITVPETRYFVMVEDHFPAGVEPVDPGLPGTVSLAAFIEHAYQDDRVTYFAERLPPGTYRVRYRSRAVVPGNFHALPAMASEVYFPEVWGSSGVDTLRIRPTSP
jgi:hypothetical protein